MEKPMILAERFFENGGWIEIFFIEIYTFVLTFLMLKTENIIKWRTRYWLLFSIIFFVQFLLGLFVNEKFLMTGKLHIPVPALIIAGPVFRGEGFFMIILLLSTILLAGPTWCSHLCYIGAWDNLASKTKKKQTFFKRKNYITIRYLMICLVVLSAILLRYLRIETEIVALLAIFFGIFGIILMIFVSRKKSYMFHCTTYCPIGALVALLGKIFPVRVKINKNLCTNCYQCTSDCKYDALRISDILKGKAGWNCTLCGDCLSSCPHNAIYFSFFGRTKNIWNYYIAFVIGLHSVFIALARL